MKISMVIPAKGSSERLKNKNLLKINEKSLVYRACEKCLKSNLIDEVYVDTESQTIIKDIESLFEKGLKLIKRPKSLANNNTSGNDLIVFERSQISETDLMLHTYSTSPLITTETIDATLSTFLNNFDDYDSFFSANYLQEYIWCKTKPVNFTLEPLPNSVDLPKDYYVETHGLYGIKSKTLDTCKQRLGGRVLPVLIPKKESLDINYRHDFELLKTLWREN